ncbi:MAG TPA: sigma-54 dependent transcriptional regulator [Thermoanaerobaculia bacterium]|nr:sigma-54 dependent transcriptional regulator [Thermoanaerobaculia bacterium]
MTILLCAPSEMDPPTIASVLDRYGLDPVPVSPEELETNFSKGVDQAVLVIPQQGVVVIGERVSEARRRLGGGVFLMVACPQLKPSDRKEILECGASALVTPSGWRGAPIGERILAELIVRGIVQPSSFGSLQGATERMRRLYRDIETVAPLSDPALILGETGTGKELVAREIHRCSGRQGSLMAVNCAALTPELLESELFGHERGAFSGAVTSRKGLLAEAGHGTIFLDEIGDLAPSAQAKLLRILEEKKVRPVGSNQWHPVHARVVLATHRDLEGASSNGAFRQDLHERIRGFSLALPPLRERRADLPLLCEHFVQEYNREHSGGRTIPDGALDPLFRYPWPGNVRELRQTVRRAAAFADSESGPISVLSLLDAVQRNRTSLATPGIPFDPAVDTWQTVHDRARALYFRTLLEETGGNKELAAKRAGISRSQFYEIFKKIDGAGDGPEEDG